MSNFYWVEYTKSDGTIGFMKIPTCRDSIPNGTKLGTFKLEKIGEIDIIKVDKLSDEKGKKQVYFIDVRDNVST